MADWHCDVELTSWPPPRNPPHPNTVFGKKMTCTTEPLKGINTRWEENTFQYFLWQLYHWVIILYCSVSHTDFTWAGRPGILTAAQVYLVKHFCFYYYYLLHFFFLSARDNETIRDRLNSGKTPLALRISYCSFCVLKNCPHSLRRSPVFPIRWFICGGPQQYPPPAAISSRVSHTRARL